MESRGNRFFDFLAMDLNIFEPREYQNRFETPFFNRAADSIMFQISKNAARWRSSFVCSLSVAPFRDVPRF